jgi:hypothetical protein
VELQRHLSSYVDPAGAVYESDGKMLRGIRPDFASFYSALLEKPPIRELLKSQLVDTRIAAQALPDYPLTLEHHKVEPLSFCYEWPPQMLKDAALLTLDLCLALSGHQLVLQDAYPWNVLFEGPRPVFVDFTSVTPEDPHLLWVAYDQFCRFFLFPLAIAQQRSGKLMRSLLLDYIDGVSTFDLRMALSWTAVLRLPWIFKRVYLTQMIVRALQGAKKGKSFVALSHKIVPTLKMRKGFFESLKRDVNGISTRVRKSFWSAYYADIETFFKPEAFDLKQKTVARLLAQLNPKTVVDIGCNRGGYAVLAALAGARVAAFDKDEDSITLLYELAKKRNLAILPLVIDLLCPSPSCGWRAIQFPSAPRRLHAEMAFALALTHHLAITQRQTFERIVAALNDYSDRWLLTEFVPMEDPRAQELLLTHKRDMRWYTLEAFLDALRNVYRQVETFPSCPDGRILILCSK